MNNKIRKIGFRGLGLLALALALSGASLAQSTGRNAVTIRGQQQDVYYYPATGAKLNRKMLFAPGDGGWRGWTITVAQQMTSWGYDVYGLDTKTYLSGFTGSTPLKDTDVMSDFKEIAKWMTKGSDERITLAGWSTGAGLTVLAAADVNKANYDGLLAISLGKTNILGWHCIDNLATWFGKTPHEATFQSEEFVPKIAPLPVFVIQSSRDEFIPQEEADYLFVRTKKPKRFRLIHANSHSFAGNREAFFAALQHGLQWITHSSPLNPASADDKPST